MTSLTSLLRMGSGAAGAQKRRIATIQNNVTNASTEGYRRQRTSLETLGGAVGGQMLGVTTGERRSIDAPLADRFVPEYRGESGQHRAKLEVATFTEGLISNEGGDLSARLGDFFASARSLEANPGDTITRRDFMERAQSLAQGVHQRHGALTRARELSQQKAGDTVDSINAKLSQIAAYDKEIMSGQGGPEAVDARDKLVAQVSDVIGARVVPGKNGAVNVITQDGAALVEGGRARALSLETSANGEMTLRSSNGRALGKIGGELGGILQADRQVIGAQLDELETFAQSFADEINQVHAQGFGLDGVNGRPLFTFTNGSASSTLAVAQEIVDDPGLIAASSSAANVPGGNVNAQAMVALQEASIIGGKRPQEALLQSASSLGQIIETTQLSLDASEGALAHLEDVQASISGVSLEEELVATTQAKHAFEASAKLISVADEMLGTVLSLR